MRGDNLFITRSHYCAGVPASVAQASYLWRMGGQLAVVVTSVSQLYTTHSQSVVVWVGKVQGITSVAAVCLKQEVWLSGSFISGTVTWKPTVRSTRFMSGREMENQETSLSCRAVTRQPSRACMI